MHVSFSLTDDGRLLAAYFKVREGTVHKTVEAKEGDCFLDLDPEGNLLGVEVIGSRPMLDVLTEVADRYRGLPLRAAAESVRRVLAA